MASISKFVAKAAAPKAAAPAPAADDWDAPTPATDTAPAPVRVRCIVHSRPHTHLKALDHGEEADVSSEVAELMRERGQVE